MQCFNPQNSNHGIYYSKSFTESKFDANIYTVKYIYKYIYSEINNLVSACFQM